MIPTPKKFAAALSRMASDRRLSQNDRDMLICHYNSDAHTLTGRQMSALMGWAGQAANQHYGRLGRRLADELGWVPTEREGYDGYFVSALVLGGRPNGDFEWTMRPQLAGALELVAWSELGKSDDAPNSRSADTVTERAAYMWQRRLERDSRAAKLAKTQHGWRCQACEMRFSDVYGSIGAEFIEAHHLVPLSEIEIGAERAYEPDDFAVLCSNCHRMIHRWPDPRNPTPWHLDEFARMVRARLSKA